MTEIGDAYVNVEEVERDAQRRVERRRHHRAVRARADQIERDTPKLVIELGLELRKIIADVLERDFGLHESHSESGGDGLDTRICLDVFDEGCGDGQGRFELGTAYLHILPVDSDVSTIVNSHDSSSSVGSGLSGTGSSIKPTEGDPHVVLDLSSREASMLQSAISTYLARLRQEERRRAPLNHGFTELTREYEKLATVVYEAADISSSLAGAPGHGSEAGPVLPSAGRAELAGEEPVRE